MVGSNTFRTAVANGNKQRMVFQFTSGTIISNEDIDIESGVDFHETFCSETDLTIGLCPSSEISFVLLNDDGHWSSFTFGTFYAYIGVLISSTANGSSAVRRPSISISGTSMTVSGNGVSETYELCKLGTFIAPRPAVVHKKRIDVQANDQMTLFYDDFPSDITFPKTAGQLLQALCTKVGVSATTYTFLNSTLSLATKPDTYETCTMREVLGHIAEVAGAIARFNRDGNLELAWFNTVQRTFNEGNYTGFEPSWYTVPLVNKLTVRNDNSNAESTVGSGSNAYLIQNNPFLRVDDSQS